MQHLLEEITQKLVAKLPASKAHYTISDLYDFQIPGFIIKRIETELRRNLADSIVPPTTEWANMDSENVSVCWTNFIKAIHEQVLLPRSYATTVMESACSDVLEMLIHPRKTTIELLFGNDETTGLDDIKARSLYITAFDYLAESIIKYMQRKKLSKISREQALKVITLIDETLTKKYSPLNWAQLVDPLFNLLGDDIETEVFRQFFSDKNKTRWADFFDKEQGNINRTRLIEILSLPELDGIEPFEDTDYEPEETGIKSLDEPETGNHTVSLEQTSNDPQIEELPSNEDSEIHLGKVRDWGLDKEETEPFNQIFEQNEIKSESVKEVQPEIATDDSFSVSSFQTSNSKTPEKETPLYKQLLKTEEDTVSETFSSKSSEELPFWKRFIPPNEAEINNDESESDVTKSKKINPKDLLNTFSDMQNEFIDELFGGDYNAYIQAMDDISAYEYWDDVSHYVKEEIFRIAQIDQLSETSIEFVDRLQNYFLSNHS